jgi:hypothetical protein
MPLNTKEAAAALLQSRKVPAEAMSKRMTKDHEAVLRLREVTSA